LNTIAPTGTTSLTLGQNCSSGIEPIFSLEYDRNIRTDRGSKTERVYDYAWLVYTSKFDTEEVPNYFKTALEIDPYKHIEVQSIAQYYIDNSISKTINIPENYSKSDYSKLFMHGYEKGLKGVTSFRIGSMKGILDTLNSKKETRPQYINRTYAPKRPPELPCDIHEISVNKVRHIVLVGKMQGTLYEIFVTNDPKNEIEKIGKKEGIIRKVKKNHYQLLVENGEDKVYIDNIGQEFDEEYSSLSRFISMGLRHGVPLQFIVDQLQKDKNFIGFERTVGRVLKKYIKEGETVLTDKCRECGEELVYQDGCVQCISCGWSKCG
jgi:ribonucleoside-diphosphate reductase alpha chain